MPPSLYYYIIFLNLLLDILCKWQYTKNVYMYLYTIMCEDIFWR